MHVSSLLNGSFHLQVFVKALKKGIFFKESSDLEQARLFNSGEVFLCGENKTFGKQLLDQKVDRQSCQREAVNSLFVVSNSYSKQTNDCRIYLLIFLIRGLLRCSCRGGMQ